MENKLIFGKSSIQRIVAIEVTDPHVELFMQDEQGNITIEQQPNRYWILASKQPDKDWVKLKGDLHYKYGKQYINRNDFTRQRHVYSKQYRDIFTIWNAQEATMVKDGYTLFKGMKAKDVSVLAFDLETTGTKMDINSFVVLIANTYRDALGVVTRKMFCYDEYHSQAAMIEAWASWVRSVDPTVICGHNINTFDLPYLQNVADFEGIDLELGRDGSAVKFDNRDSKFRKEGGQTISYRKCKIFGRHVIDTFFLAIKHDQASRKYENYKLKNIIAQEGLEQEGRQFYDAATIKDNYKIPSELVKIKSYAQFDGDDALALYDLMCPAYFYFTQSVPKTYQSILESSTGAPLNAILLRAYLQDGHSIPKASDITEKVEGGISFAVPGIYKNLLKVDLKSAYPSQILRFKLFDKNKDPEGYFYEMVKYFTYERFDLKDMYKKTTDKYYSDREQSGKVVINSAYGLTNTNGLNFNSQEVASKITGETRELIDMALKWASGKDKHYWINLFEEKTK